MTTLNIGGLWVCIRWVILNVLENPKSKQLHHMSYNHALAECHFCVDSAQMWPWCQRLESLTFPSCSCIFVCRLMYHLPVSACMWLVGINVYLCSCVPVRDPLPSIWSMYVGSVYSFLILFHLPGSWDPPPFLALEFKLHRCITQHHRCEKITCAHKIIGNLEHSITRELPPNMSQWLPVGWEEWDQWQWNHQASPLAVCMQTLPPTPMTKETAYGVPMNSWRDCSTYAWLKKTQ